MPGLTDVPGIRVGHAADPEARTGCTVLLGPFRGACDVRGLATGTRELDVLSPLHLVHRIDALLLTGGSAFGLAAADGVMEWLEERGEGFDARVARVPLVPAAVIFDLGEGRADVRPNARMGRAACDAASAGVVAEGRVGAGTGATVGKLAGPAGSMPGGVGTWSASFGQHRIGSLAVVNALGDVLDGGGSILAGARTPTGSWLNAARALREGRSGEIFGGAAVPPPGTNTTLAVVATDAPLTRVALQQLARGAAAALPRRITPVHTPFDGDVVFALSTAAEGREQTASYLMGLGEAAAYALEQAIERGVVG